MMRSEDLAPMLAAQPAAGVGFRKGTVVTWNALTAANTIDIDGATFTDLPTLASSAEVLMMKPGDVVGIWVVGNGATSTMYIDGRITLPGTPQAASFMELFGIKSADVDTNEILSDTGGAFVSLTGGPAVSNVLVGNTGRALVTVSADILCAPIGAGGRAEGWMGFEITGATSVAPNVFDTLRVRFTRDSDVAGNPAVNVAASRTNLVVGLNSGLHTFTAQYRVIAPGNQAEFQGRNITVMPL